MTLVQFLSQVYPLNLLNPKELEDIAAQLQPYRYSMGREILKGETLPEQMGILYQGQARLLAHEPHSDRQVTLKLLQPGAMVGVVSWLRRVPCEIVKARDECILLTLTQDEFAQCLNTYPQLRNALAQQVTFLEIFTVLKLAIEQQPYQIDNFRDLVPQVAATATLTHFAPGRNKVANLDRDRVWLVSGGGEIVDFPVGAYVDCEQEYVEVRGSEEARLIGLPQAQWQSLFNSVTPQLFGTEIIEGPELDGSIAIDSAPVKYPLIRARGPVEVPLACLEMVSQYVGIPFRKASLHKLLTEQISRSQKISLLQLGAIAELMGLKGQVVKLRGKDISRLPTPALIFWQDSLALLYKTHPRQLVLASPEFGLRNYKVAQFLDLWGDGGEALLLEATKETPQKQFGISWFIPSLLRYKGVLLEVFLASFFVQLLALANPLLIQNIIDKVIIQNNLGALQVLGFLLLIMAVFESVLTSLRTYLFADTTNRIDLSLGAEIINHLLRQPLSYFEKRSVGELSSRVNELENIRSFLTGTALTIVLDGIFSLIYIGVMMLYNPLLTLVALGTLPLFLLLTLIASPLLQKQLRAKAEQNARTQSYLVQVLNGIHTVKAQNLERHSRNIWQQRYSRYVVDSFRTVITGTLASSTSNFLNKVSQLLVIWVGAYLVVKGQLSLGELIAFRIISGYVTTPLMRLAQIWQNFQETALSLERLRDILDRPQEQPAQERENVPLPLIEGAVQYKNVSFRFPNSKQLQLNKINLQVTPGTFVGIVGQSGSGKSTLTKLLVRFYYPEQGKILIDNYDITKVELYSLRRQMGVVPQDSLLFEGTVQENIALTNPEATIEEIIAAAKVAVAHDFIMNLANGYNTNVGERGANLSGGQRQRIAIARTILQNPRMLILDEATSALDYATEQQVCFNLAQAAQERTVFFITHRLNTIKNADLILVMDNGQIIEQGNHEELMALQGNYYCLYGENV